MLNKLNTKQKLLLFPVIFAIIVICVGIIYTHYNNVSNSRNEVAIMTDDLIQDVLKGRISAYAFLRAPSEESAQKVSENFAYIIKQVFELKNKLSSERNKVLADEIIFNAKKYIEYFEIFSKPKISDFNNGIKEDSLEIKNNISKMAKYGLILEENLTEIHENAMKLKEKSNSYLNKILIIIAVFSNLIFLLISLLIANTVIKSLNNFKEGLLSFFSYLNRESSTVSILNDKIKDEFGEMAQVVNQSIEKTKKGIEEDRKLIDETINVLSEFEQGDLSQRLTMNVSNPALIQLKNVLNDMGVHLEKNFNNVLNTLEEYSNHKYINQTSTTGLKEHLLKLANGVNHLGTSITNMLIENKSNGLTLDESSNILLTNVDKLNQSSNEAAASLEEMTSNIRLSTENIEKMASYSNNVTKSANDGEKLAIQTTVAMDEINTQVNAINEAITVIDQIAFQTNILSLNAAVEAATAGEAKKDFVKNINQTNNVKTEKMVISKVKNETKVLPVKINDDEWESF